MVEVCVPYLSEPHRDRALAWVLDRYEYPVTIAPGSEPWSKALATMPAIYESKASVVIVADADVWTEGLPEAVSAVEGGAPWAIPHGQVFRLSPEGTEAVYQGQSWQDQTLDRRPYLGVWGGGIVVARREVILSTPLDCRFTGWG